MLIDFIAGARPNFIKIAPLIKVLEKFKLSKIKYRLVHTGQHFDHNMSQIFFNQLKIPKPDINLNAGSGTQSEQTSKIMIKYEKLLNKKKSDLCIVVGDVNSTMACTIVAKKMGISVAHVEAGIRSGDMTMPEEINRIVTDSISDYFFTTSNVATNNLLKSGINKSNIFFVGNTMIDTLLEHKKNFYLPKMFFKNKLIKNKYIVLTLHRPSNVDKLNKIEKILNNIIMFSDDIKIVFPVHPRTNKILKNINYDKSKVILSEPMSYFEFNCLVENSKGVITDSGGITEETTIMNIPCITLRDTTERPETVSIGTNILVGSDFSLLKKNILKMINGNWKQGRRPKYWDGKTSNRIINIILNKLKID